MFCGDTRGQLAFEVRRIQCRTCGKVKSERLDFLANNPFCTKRFAWHIGRRCRQSAVSAVGKEFKLDWHTVKTLDKQYLAEQIERTGTPATKAVARGHPVGIDEISIRKGHTYRIVVSDLIRKRPIWFGDEEPPWDCQREGWARRFFDNRRKSLRWQRLRPFEKSSITSPSVI